MGYLTEASPPSIIAVAELARLIAVKSNTAVGVFTESKYLYV